MKKLLSSFEELSKLKPTNSIESSYSDQFIKFESRNVIYSNEVKALFNKIDIEVDVDGSIKELISGSFINKSENKAASHPKLRNDSEEFLKTDFPKIIKLKHELITNNKKNIVVLGIGGSYEGPNLLLEALKNFSNEIFNFYFINGSDEKEFHEVMHGLLASETNFIVSSKSLNTQETLESLKHAKKWLKENSDEESLKSNIVVLTANEKKAKTLFKEKNIFLIDDEIGGRYSVWSNISVPAILDLEENYIKFLEGGNEVDKLITSDKSFKEFIKDLSYKDIWENNFLNFNNRILLSYSWPLRSFPNYAQQLEMESLGKPANPKSIFKKTSQTIFGGFGPKAQHSYFQQLHQGTENYSIDLFSTSKDRIDEKLISKQLQAQLTLFKKCPEELKGSKEEVKANVNFNHFELAKIDPFHLGYLIALWEYRTFITAKILQINPFDQFGVEAGKKLTEKL